MEVEKPFGHRLYDELREQGLHAFLTSRLNYADIQRLKAADRTEVVKMFRGSSYAWIQRLKEDEPGELARFLSVEHARAQAAAAAIVILGVAIS